MEKKRYELAFKRAAVDRLVAGESATALARELDIRRKFLYQWKSAGLGSAGQTKAGPVVEEDARQRELGRLKKQVENLERLAGRQAAELDFFAAALRSMKEARPQSGAPTGRGSIA